MAHTLSSPHPTATAVAATKMLLHHNSPCGKTHITREQCRNDLLHDLDPAYQPQSYASTSTNMMMHRDVFGNLHDPSYRLFPTDEWKQQRRRSQNAKPADSDDEEDERQETQYLHASHSRSRSRTPTSSAYSSPLLPTSPLPSSPSYSPQSYHSALPTPLPTPTSPKHTHHSLVSRLRKSRKPTHEWYDEDAASDPEFSVDEQEASHVQSAPETRREQEEVEWWEGAVPQYEVHDDDDDDDQVASLSSSTSKMKRSWQALQLSLQISKIRGEKRSRSHTTMTRHSC